jgi:hypothetical protein
MKYTLSHCPRSLAVAACLSYAATACSSSSSSATPPGDAGGATADGTASDFAHAYVFTMQLTVPAGQELHKCQFVQVPPGPDLKVTGFAHQYTPGSHHFLMYSTTLTAIPPDLSGQYDCTTGDEPIWKDSVGIIYGAQTPNGGTRFPDGVAATLKAGQVLLMNTHYLNPQTTDMDTVVKVGLDVTSPDKVQQEGGFFLFYDPFIDVPGHAKASSGIRCAIPTDVTIVSAFTHYHYRGTKMDVFNDGPTTPAAAPFYSTSDWEHPAAFAGPMPLAKGSFVRTQCDFNNTENDEVFQGPNARTSEMCVLGGTYYPKQDSFETCAVRSISGFGTKACLDLAKCVQTCPTTDAPRRTPAGAQVGPCWERCVTSGCSGAVDNLMPLLACVRTQCAAECPSGDNCLACTAANCQAPLSACSSHSCP